MSDESGRPRGSDEVLPDGSGGGDGLDGDTGSGGDGGSEDVEGVAGDEEAETIAPRLSDDGIMLFFAGAASLLAAVTAAVTGQPWPVPVLAGIAGGVATVAFVVDIATDFVPDNRVHAAVGATALVGALLSLPGRDWVNGATLGAAAALVLWRVVDTRFRGAER